MNNCTSKPGFQPPSLKSFLGPGRTDPPTNEWVYQTVSRCVDVVVSATVLLLTAPLIFGIALAVRLDSPSPALFRHTRIGMNRRRSDERPSDLPERRVEDRYGRPFVLFKFRTMFVDARERYPTYYDNIYSEEQLYTLPMKALYSCQSEPDYGKSNEPLGNDPRLKPVGGWLRQTSLDESPDLINALFVGNDPRRTPIGRWLRRTSLDELPNLVNVLLGEMSLVGNRPEMGELVAFYRREHLHKFDLKPGVTGLAQVLGRGNLSFHQINAYDTEYVENHSLRLYFWILFRTIRVVLKGEGAY